jgi:UDP-N-acetylmuramoylalanine--D-glutamate ligase
MSLVGLQTGCGMNFLHGRSVLILGLGDSGLAMARWCAARGAQLQVWDSRDEPPQAGALAAELPLALRRTGALRLDALEGVALVLKSPGLAPADARIAPVLAEARARGLAVMGELDLFVQALQRLRETQGYAPQLLAITGTNGKTTTTAMTALLVERAGKRVVAAGNIGPTLLDTLAARLEDLPEVWVLELSSFQLEGGGQGVRGFEPAAAVVLNVTQDHLDWHGSMSAYAAAKARVFGTSGVMVVNRDDALVQAMLPPPAAPVAKGRGRKDRLPERVVLRFGLGAPQRPGDFGLVVDGGMAWLVRALPADETLRRKSGEDEEIHLQRLMPADALRVRGRHNAANALAALALATAIGCPLAPMLHGLREYAGEAHRLQFVASVDGIEAYDDSKGTNVGATVAALEGLGADKAPGRLVVILGGEGKGQDFSPLTAALARHARAVATIGRDAAAVEAVVPDLPLQRHASLEAALEWCFAQARPGDAVLLSPACASLDMFRNYGQRGEVFAQGVLALAHDRGQA